VEAQIVKITNFGAFAEIEKGIEGLIHVSQLSSRRVTDPKKVVKVGQNVKAKIINMDIPNRKIGLSIKAYNEGLNAEEVEAEIQNLPEESAESEE
jgi:ribosomal protein S1